MNTDLQLKPLTNPSLCLLQLQLYLPLLTMTNVMFDFIEEELNTYVTGISAVTHQNNTGGKLW